MNNEDNVYELLGNVQVLTKEGVETKFEELEASLPQKINDALGTSLDERIDEAVSNAVIDAGGVTPALLDEVKAELVATDTALQATDTLLDQRITALENAEPSGGPTTDELLVLTLGVDVEDITDTTAWLLKEVINFDALYQSYLAKTNKPVVINIAMSDDTGSTQYSFRDVITSADATQIRITGDAMSAAIAPNLRFTIDLVLIKNEATGNCIINTTESKLLMQEDTGGGSGEAVPEKIFEFTGEYLLDNIADEPIFTVNIDAIDSDKFKEAVDDSYKFQLRLRAPQTKMPIVITTYIYAIQGAHYVFGFNLDSLGVVDTLYGRVQISVMQNEETGNYELGTCDIDKGDDYTLNLTTLDKRVTTLENASGSTAEDKSLVITLSVINPEALDEGIAISNLRFAEETNFNDLFEKARTGEYNATVNLIINKDDSGTVYYSAKPAQLQVVTEDTKGKPLIFCDVIFDLGGAVLTNFISIKSDMNGNCIIDSGSGEDKFQESKLASGDAVDVLDERVTALEENGSGGGGTADDLSNYTYIIDSQEKFDAFCTATNATETDGNDYSHVYIKNGDYTQTTAIKIDNTVVPVLSITGESQNAVVITYSTTLFSISTSDSLDNCTISNMTLKIADGINTAYLITPYDTSGNLIESHVIFADCTISTCAGFACAKLQSCTVNLTITTAEGSLAKNSSSTTYYLIYCAYIYNTNITLYNSAISNTKNYSLYALFGNDSIYSTQNSAFENSKLQITHLVQADKMSFSAIAHYNQCTNSSCILDDFDYLKYACLFGTIRTYLSAGFSQCNNLTNCTVKNFKICFYGCHELSNCSAYLYYACCANSSGSVYYMYSTGFDTSVDLTNCHVYGAYDESLRASVVLHAINPLNSTTANLKLIAYAYVSCKNLSCCYDDIRVIQYAAKCSSLHYMSYAACTNVSYCTSSLANIYANETLSAAVTTQHNIAGFANCNSVVAPYFSNTYVKITDGRDDKTTQLSSLPFNLSHITTSRNISNFYIKENSYMTPSDTTVGDVLYYISKTNAGLMNSTLQVTNTISEPSFQITNTTGIQGCVLKAPDTTTCSASQTYTADYAVADTPAGGFNKIVS